MRLIIATLILLVSGCASTSIKSFTDPGYSNKKFTSFLVATSNISLDFAADIQSDFCERLIRRKIRCFESVKLLPPTRNFNAEEKKQILLKNEINAYILISLGKGNIDVPKSSVMMLNFSNTYPSIGVSPRRRRDGFDIFLFDVDTGGKAWVAGAKVKGKGRSGASDSAFSISLTSNIIRDLEKEGLI